MLYRVYKTGESIGGNKVPFEALSEEHQQIVLMLLATNPLRTTTGTRIYVLRGTAKLWEYPDEGYRSVRIGWGSFDDAHLVQLKDDSDD